MALPSPPSLIAPYSSISETAMEYLHYHLSSYKIRETQFEALIKEPSAAFTHTENVPNMQQLATAQLVKSLRDDPAAGIEKVLTDSLPAHLWDSVINDPRIHYSSFRRMNSLKAEKDGLGERDEVDVWIQRNERWLRVNGTNWGLVTLQDAKAIFPTATHTPTEIVIPRRQPPSTSFCFLDEKRPTSLSIIPSNELFVETFNRVTNNCLKDLNWDNVFLAGGMALNTLLCTHPDMETGFPDSDLDLYIYGLSPMKANEKINQIYKVWCTNVGKSSVGAGLCIKNSKTINFLGKFPDRRIQIVLRLVQTPAEVLLNFDLDPCAIGFDGENVLMLPRAARALETGYTTFTSFLVYGHHLGERRASQEIRCFKYGLRGFGIRILSCYMKDLATSGDKRLQEQNTKDLRSTSNYLDAEILKGLKELKRLALLAEDLVRRCVLNEFNGEVKDPGDFDYRKWATGPNGKVPVCSFKTLDAHKQHIGRPNGRAGIGNFELFFRHCAAWKLEREGRIKIDYDDFAEMYDTRGSYDELPTFSWNISFNLEKVVKDIDIYNRRLPTPFKEFTDVRIPGSEEILPARIVYAKTLQGLSHKQIAIPILLDGDLEGQSIKLYDEAMRTSGLDDPLFYRCVDRGNNSVVRLWLIGKQTVWARVDRKIDEIFEIFWTLFHLQQETPEHVSGLEAEEDEYDPGPMSGALRQHLERRVIRHTSRIGNEDKDFFNWPSEEEKELFRFWVRNRPKSVYRGFEAPFCTTELFFEDEERFKEPDEERYWGSEDEKEDGRVWRNIGEDVKKKRKRIDSQVIAGEKFARV